MVINPNLGIDWKPCGKMLNQLEGSAKICEKVEIELTPLNPMCQLFEKKCNYPNTTFKILNSFCWQTSE